MMCKYRVASSFSRSLISRVFNFRLSKNQIFAIWILEFIPENKFSRISCTVLESNKNGGHIVISLFTVLS